MLTLTDLAKAKIIEIAEAEGLKPSVRVKIIGGGCAGFQYDMFYDDKPLDLDEVFKFGEVELIIDPVSSQYFENVEIDFLDAMINGGFKFNNPDATGSCGCGKSISF